MPAIDPAVDKAPDVAVVGAGPAGLALATALAEQGLGVVLVDPAPFVRWRNTFAIWTAELGPLGLGLDVTAANWPGVLAGARGVEWQRLSRGYSRLDNAACQRVLHARFSRAGGRSLCARAAAAGPGLLTLHDAEPLHPLLIVDASGHQPVLLPRSGAGVPGQTAGAPTRAGASSSRERAVRGGPARAVSGSPAPAVQSAYGVRGRLSGPAPALLPAGQAVLMDWRQLGPGARAQGDPQADPTFLYALDLGDGTVFLEETSLARRLPLPQPLLRARLEARLDAAEVEFVEVLEVEHCLFPMGAGLPPVDAHVVGFGAAAGLVHPATGYQVGTAFTLAPVVAAAVAAAVRSGLRGEPLLARARAAVWPRDRRLARRLHQFGLQVLLRLSGPDLQDFFESFFDLPERHQTAYLSGSADPRSVAAAMTALFGSAPALRGRLARPALTPRTWRSLGI